MATVDGRAITVDDLESEMERRGGAANFATRAGVEELLGDLVRLEVLVANARRVGLHDDRSVRQETKYILAGRYQQERLGRQLEELKVTEQEIEDRYRDHGDRYTAPPAARAALIYFAHPKTASAPLRQQLLERAASVRAAAAALPNDADFGDLAARHSDDQASRYLGGDIGWVVEGQSDSRFGDRILDAIFALDDAGAMSDLIETPEGVYLVRLLAKRPARLRPLDEVEGAIRHELLVRKRRAASDQFFTEAFGNVSVDINEKRVAAIELPEASVADRVRRPPPLPQS